MRCRSTRSASVMPRSLAVLAEARVGVDPLRLGVGPGGEGMDVDHTVAVSVDAERRSTCCSKALICERGYVACPRDHAVARWLEGGGMGGERPDTLSTYRHLRLAMAMLLGLLLVAVGLRALSAPGICFEGSISAYYFTSVRAVFVATLCALGTCLIVYRGNRDAEDIALNASGALAFVVAFVPTRVPKATGVSCSASNVPDAAQLKDAVNNNMVAMIIVSFVAIAVAMALVVRSNQNAGQAGRSGVGTAPRCALWVFLGVLVAGSLAFALWPVGFRANAHATAAFGTFIGIVAVVAINAIDTRGRVAFRRLYMVIAAAMVASMVVIGVLYRLVSGWRHGLLWIEATLLLEFLAFWVVQTIELWNETRRDTSPVP